MARIAEILLCNIASHFTVHAPLESSKNDDTLDRMGKRCVEGKTKDKETKGKESNPYRVKGKSCKASRPKESAPIVHGYSHSPKTSSYVPPLGIDQVQHIYTFKSEYPFTKSQNDLDEDKLKMNKEHGKRKRRKKRMTKSLKNSHQIKLDCHSLRNHNNHLGLAPLDPPGPRKIIPFNVPSNNALVTKVPLPNVGQSIESIKCEITHPVDNTIEPVITICKVGDRGEGENTSKDTRKNVSFYLLVLVQEFNGITNKLVSKPYPIQLQNTNEVASCQDEGSSAIT